MYLSFPPEVFSVCGLGHVFWVVGEGHLNISEALLGEVSMPRDGFGWMGMYEWTRVHEERCMRYEWVKGHTGDI